MTAPDLRPSDDPSAAATMETGPEHQLAHQMVGELCKLCGVPWSEACWRAACPKAKPLAKVLPAGGPLVATWWTCSICGHSKPGGPPSVCAVEANLLPPHLTVDGCPLNHPPA